MPTSLSVIDPLAGQAVTIHITLPASDLPLAERPYCHKNIIQHHFFIRVCRNNANRSGNPEFCQKIVIMLRREK